MDLRVAQSRGAARAGKQNAQSPAALPALKLPSGANRSVARAFRILTYISRSGSAQSFADLQRTLRFPKASLHKLLLTLEALGYLQRDFASGRYSMGWAAFDLSAGTNPAGGLLEVISPVMRRLEVISPVMRRPVDRYNETGHIGVLDGTEEIIVERIDPPQQVLRLAIARRHPAYATSGGLAALAARADATLDDFPTKLAPLTENTVKTRKALAARLEQIRRDGYAFDMEEAYLGVRCVGVAISVKGWPIAALSLSIPLQRATVTTLQKLTEPLMKAATEIEGKLAVTPRP
jgi:DNA-binding IclR family transcriptional regulator